MRRLVLVIAALATAALLAACGRSGSAATAHGGHSTSTTSTSTSTSSTSSAAGHNAADVTFAQLMIPHHEQAVEMSRLAADRAADPAVKELATQIEAAQAPEIKAMARWLASWGEPTAPAGGMAGMGHGGHGGPGGPGGPGDAGARGMMSDADMGGLRAVSGAVFDRMFLEMMIRHHEGAIEMARAERRDGLFRPAVQLAATIEDTQAREVASIRAMLDRK